MIFLMVILYIDKFLYIYYILFYVKEQNQHFIKIKFVKESEKPTFILLCPISWADSYREIMNKIRERADCPGN